MREYQSPKSPTPRATLFARALSRLFVLLSVLRTFQEIDGLARMHQGLIYRVIHGPRLHGLCCYSTEAVIQDIRRCPQLLAFIP